MKTIDKQSVSLYVPIYALSKSWKGTFNKLPPNKTYTLIIGYPLNNPAKIEVKTGKTGMGVANLLAKIGESYRNVYDNAERFGIWGHDIDDLILSGVNVNHKTKMITLDVDS